LKLFNVTNIGNNSLLDNDKLIYLLYFPKWDKFPKMGKIFIYGQIGKEVNIKDTIQAIEKETESLEVHINSPGGDVYGGFAIYNALQRKQNILSTYIDGLAYSAASWIALAAKPGRRFMSKASQFGIHQASSFGGGNKDQLALEVEQLAKIDEIQVDIYAHNTGLSRDRINQLMKTDTPLNITEAAEFGFVEYQQQKIAALFNIETSMDFQEKLKAFGEMLKGTKNEVSENIAEKVNKETETAIKEAETVKAAFNAEFTAAKEFKAFQEGIQGFVDATLDYISKQPTKEEIEKWIEAKANEKVVKFIAEYRSQGTVPQAEENSFNDEAVKNYGPLTLPKNVDLNSIFKNEKVN